MKVMDDIPFTIFPIKKKKENENKTIPQNSTKHKVINFRSRKGKFPEKSWVSMSVQELSEGVLCQAGENHETGRGWWRKTSLSAQKPPKY